MRPMLADTITMRDLPRYANDDAWFGQRKVDGHRLLIEILDGQVRTLNRSGQPKTTMVSHALLGEFEAFDSGHWVFDGELVGTQLALFDLPVAQGHVAPSDPFERRFEVLSVLYQEWHPTVERVSLLPVARTPDEKLMLARVAEDEHWEGIMLRHRDGIYAPGRRSAQLLKCKFIKDIDAIVYQLRVGGHDNAELVLLDPEPRLFPQNPDYPPGVLPIGQASAIGKRPAPTPGDVWEVRFLYMVDPAKPRLYQPRLIRKRSDKELHECTADQIANAFTDKNLTVKTRSST